MRTGKESSRPYLRAFACIRGLNPSSLPTYQGVVGIPPNPWHIRDALRSWLSLAIVAARSSYEATPQPPIRKALYGILFSATVCCEQPPNPSGALPVSYTVMRSSGSRSRVMSKKATPLLPRRKFLKTALAAGGAAVLAPTIIPSSALGLDGAVAPSERVVIGGIGIGNRGTYDLGCFLEQKDVQFVAVCDIKEKRRDAVKQIVESKYQATSNCDTYRDFRELLDRKDIDAVLIATGPNWHCTAAMYAAKAGKDMYCEKPCTKNIAQSLTLAETIRRTGRVFQAGTQRRNLPHFAFACELARTGKLGKLQRSTLTRGHARPDERLAAGRAGAGKGRSRLGHVPWPRRVAPFNAKLLDGFNFEKGWRHARRGRRRVLEWGSHCVDLCQWAVGDCAAPGRVQPAQGRPNRRPAMRTASS